MTPLDTLRAFWTLCRPAFGPRRRRTLGTARPAVALLVPDPAPGVRCWPTTWERTRCGIIEQVSGFAFTTRGPRGADDAHGEAADLLIYLCAPAEWGKRI